MSDPAFLCTHPSYDSSNSNYDGDIAKSVGFSFDEPTMHIHLMNGVEIQIPLKLIQGMDKVITYTDLRNLGDMELLGGGTGICFDKVDLHLSITNLAKGIYGNKEWMVKLGCKDYE